LALTASRHQRRTVRLRKASGPAQQPALAAIVESGAKSGSVAITIINSINLKYIPALFSGPGSMSRVATAKIGLEDPLRPGLNPRPARGKAFWQPAWESNR
jgi:hypothetical protein